MIGEPVMPPCHAMSSNRSSSLPALANRQHRSDWARDRTFTQNRSEGAIASHVMLFVIGRKPTIGGSSDTDVNEPIVNPAGRSPFMPVTIVTPVGKCPRTVRNCFGSMAGASGIALDRRGRAPRAAVRCRRGWRPDRGSQTDAATRDASTPARPAGPRGAFASTVGTSAGATGGGGGERGDAVRLAARRAGDGTVHRVVPRAGQDRAPPRGRTASGSAHDRRRDRARNRVHSGRSSARSGWRLV